MKISTAKTLLSALLALSTLALVGCSGAAITGGTAAVAYVTSPSTPPPADTASQIAEHESWCYQTLGYAECYPHPQDVPPGRLINVDPQNRYPLTSEAYDDMIIEDQ